MRKHFHYLSPSLPSVLLHQGLRCVHVPEPRVHVWATSHLLSAKGKPPSCDGRN